MAKKTIRQRVKEQVFLELQNNFHVTEKELTSGAFYYGDANVTVDDVLPHFEREYNVTLKGRNYANWEQFAESIGIKVSQKRKF